ncbi:MAG: HAD hydrolase family protein, partial [Atopobiaceae bacterium]|nr:HAD hydrolase family protein [Atopobiaceae bacterium]
EIMRMVGHPIAMGNALYGLKQVCERVIETNLEHGVQKDLARLLARIRAGEDSERISFDEEDE